MESACVVTRTLRGCDEGESRGATQRGKGDVPRQSDAFLERCGAGGRGDKGDLCTDSLSFSVHLALQRPRVVVARPRAVTRRRWLLLSTDTARTCTRRSPVRADNDALNATGYSDRRSLCSGLRRHRVPASVDLPQPAPTRLSQARSRCLRCSPRASSSVDAALRSKAQHV